MWSGCICRSAEPLQSLIDTSLLCAVRVIDCDGTGSIAQIIAGLEWISSNAELPAVVLMSIGGTATTVLDTAVQGLTTQGITVVVAAGNSAEGQASETDVAPCTALVFCPFRVTAWQDLQKLPTQPQDGLHCLLSRHAFFCVPSLTGVAVADMSAASSPSPWSSGASLWTSFWAESLNVMHNRKQPRPSLSRATLTKCTACLACGHYCTSVQFCCADACLESPARQPSVIAVAATDSSDSMASFSDGGACVELLAPGVSILSVNYASNTGYT